MTGSRLSFRRHSNCNLHVSSPPGHSPQFSREHRERRSTFLERLARTRLHVPDEQSDAARERGGFDRYGPWVWMFRGDCLWEWLALRPFMYTPLGEPLYRLHEHVHEEHDHPDRHYVFAPLQRSFVRALERADTVLDAIPTISRRPLTFYRYGDLGCRLGLADLSSRLDERWQTDVWKAAHGYRISVTFSQLSDHQVRQLEEEVHSETFQSEPARPGYAPYGERTPRTKVTWVEWASNPTLARDQAQALVMPLALGGSSWETPTRIDA